MFKNQRKTLSKKQQSRMCELINLNVNIGLLRTHFYATAKVFYSSSYLVFTCKLKIGNVVLCNVYKRCSSILLPFIQATD